MRAPVVNRIFPSVQDKAVPLTVMIEGERFVIRVSRQLSHEDEFVVDESFVAALSFTQDTDETDKVFLENVQYVDSETLTATIPADAAPGRFDLEIITPHGLTGVLEDAFTVQRDSVDSERRIDSDTSSNFGSDSHTEIALDTDTDAGSDIDFRTDGDRGTDTRDDFPSDIQVDPPTETHGGTQTDTFVAYSTDTQTVLTTDTGAESPTDTFVVLPSDTFVDIPTDTLTEAQTETFEQPPTNSQVDFPTDTQTVPSTDTRVQSPTDTFEVLPSDTQASTDTQIPIDTQVDLPTDTQVPTDTWVDLPSDTQVSTDTWVALPTDTQVSTDTWVQTTFPSSCKGVVDENPLATDGVFTLYWESDPTQPWVAYCHDMSGTPAEYLELVNTGGDYNFSQYTAGGNSPGTDVRTNFTRLRLDPDTLQVDICDRTFASSTGEVSHSGDYTVTNVAYGYAVACVTEYDGSGLANINLEGTAFQVEAGQMVSFGYRPAGGDTISANGQVYDMTGGGNCGYRGPEVLFAPWDCTPAFWLELQYIGD